MSSVLMPYFNYYVIAARRLNMNRLILTLAMVATLIVPGVALAEVQPTGLICEIKQLTDFDQLSGKRQAVVLEGKVLKVSNKLRSNHSVLYVPLDEVTFLYASGASVFFEGEFSEELSGGSAQKLLEASIKVRSSQDADKLMDLLGLLVIDATKKPVAAK
jgi:hypothetical protein